MQLHIDDQSTVRPWEQLYRQLVDLIEKGDLLPGDKLVPVRTVAAELDLAPNTVARVYRELERHGFVETRSRAGTTVSSLARFGSAAERTRALASAAREFVAAAERLGFDEKTAVGAVRKAWAADT